MIQAKTIDGVLLRDMVVAGATLLEKHREAVDALNVFPVPDGDTGTNMSLTMASATREVNQKEYLNAGEAAAAVSKGALKGARGNSGVITSQLLRGFSRALAGVERITPAQFAAALKSGAETAYKAVMKPKEGTILTVARVIAEEAVKQAERTPDDYDALFTNILSTGEVILKKTQQMLPALTQAGVVDAGGRGLLYIYMGYAAVLRGEELPSDDEAEGVEGDSYEDEHSLTGELKYIYCTEFGVENLFPDIVEEDIDSLRRRLNRIGDCVRVTGDLSAVKVHVHTNEPAKALEFGLSLGELIDLKIENMAQKRREAQPKEEPQAEPQPAAQQEPPKESGMVAVSLGEGFNQIFRDLTVDQVVEGGQTQHRGYFRSRGPGQRQGGLCAAQQRQRDSGGPAGGRTVRGQEGRGHPHQERGHGHRRRHRLPARAFPRAECRPNGGSRPAGAHRHRDLRRPRYGSG